MSYSILIPILLTIGGLTAIVGSWIQYQKDNDLQLKNDKQAEELLSQQKEINKKSEEIIRIQKILDEKSQLQITNLNRLAHPIPKTSKVTFISELQISESEYDDMLKDIQTSGVQTGNLLPTAFVTDRPIIHKLNQFKDILCNITAVVTNGNKKKITINRRLNPTYFGFNSPGTLDAFILSYNAEKDKKIILTGLSIDASVDFSYDEGSFLDFKNSEVEISIEFSLPIVLKFGAQVKKQYKSEPDFMRLILNEFTINFEGYPPIVLKEFTEKTPNKFYAKIKE